MIFKQQFAFNYCHIADTQIATKDAISSGWERKGIVMSPIV
jgi:hypothetical protein